MYLQFETEGVICTERVDGVFFIPRGREDHDINPFDDEDFLVTKTSNHWMIWSADFGGDRDGHQIARRIIVNRSFLRSDRISSFAATKIRVPPVRRYRPEIDGRFQLLPRQWEEKDASFRRLEQKYRAKVDVGPDGASPVHVSRAFQVLYSMLEHR